MHVVAYLSFENYFSKKNSSQSKLHIEITWGAFNTRDSCVLNPLFPFWFHWGTAWELGFINGLRWPSISAGVEHPGVECRAANHSSCALSPKSTGCVRWREGKGLSRKQASGQRPRASTHPLGSIPGLFTVEYWFFVYPVAMDFRVLLLGAPCPLPGGESWNQAIAQGCSHERLYWQIVINFNEINLLRYKSPRWHLQVNGLLSAGGIKRRDLLLLWRMGGGVHVSVPFKPLICDSKPNEKPPESPGSFEGTSILFGS